MSTNTAALETLRRALIEGEQSGEPKAFDFGAFIAAKRSAATRDSQPVDTREKDH